MSEDTFCGGSHMCEPPWPVSHTGLRWTCSACGRHYRSACTRHLIPLTAVARFAARNPNWKPVGWVSPPRLAGRRTACDCHTLACLFDSALHRVGLTIIPICDAHDRQILEENA